MASASLKVMVYQTFRGSLVAEDLLVLLPTKAVPASQVIRKSVSWIIVRLTVVEISSASMEQKKRVCMSLLCRAQLGRLPSEIIHVFKHVVHCFRHSLLLISCPT